MTDTEIMKALECCMSNSVSDCENCPRFNSPYKTVDDCMCNLKVETLNLINRQKAEIERLQKESNQFADIGKMHSEIKADAIKEFAELVKKQPIQVV